MSDFPFEAGTRQSSAMGRLLVASSAGNEIIGVAQPVADTAPDDFADWKSSEAYLRSDGSSASPSITIKERTIWVYHAQTGGGNVRYTELKGAGYYSMSQGGAAYNVEPGTYTHRVIGHILNDGWIASGIRYK